MDKILLSTLLNAVLQDLKDRHFIAMAKRRLESSHQDIQNDPDVKLTIQFLDELIAHDVYEHKEGTYMINSLDFSEDVKGNLDDTRYSRKFKRDLLTNLGTSSVVSHIQPIVDRIQDSLTKVKLSNGKLSADSLNSVYQDVEELNQVSFKSKVSTMSGKYLIFDPISGDSFGTLGNVYDEMQDSVSNMIKTIPSIDQLFGGGMRPSSATIFAARPANFKSGMLHNIALYASMNNNVSNFNLKPGMKPCITFFSLELFGKQIFQRHLEWCGVHLTDEEVKNMSEDELTKLVQKSYELCGLNIPIIYVIRIAGSYDTTMEDVISECRTIENTYGFQSVMCLVDYIDRMEVSSKEHKKMSSIGAEGSALLRQKGKEIRTAADHLKIPIVTAAQLSGEAETIIGQYSPYLRQLDLLHAFHVGMLAGSKLLNSELESLVFLHKIVIENKNQEGDAKESKTYIACRLLKDRDNLASYAFSPRDIAQHAAYRRYTMQIKNSRLQEMLKITSEPHIVIPLDHYKLSEDDYAHSIRCFYPSEKSDFTSIHDLMEQQKGMLMSNGNDMDMAFRNI